MKTSLAWINAYLQVPVDATTARDLLSAQGFPVEAMEEVDLGGGRRDTVLDVEVTSNRSDVLSHRGVAREIAAGGGQPLKAWTVAAPALGPAPEGARVSVDLPGDCPLYTARLIENVTIGPSPQWLVDYLTAVGLRPVNNVVDITNFVLLETGQPLHAFDFDQLEGGCIEVRTARPGEKMIAIDESEHELNGSMMVIADARRPVAIAGVMGGKATEVTGSTRRLLLEAAIFEPLSVRSTSRRLKLASDSSYRFERGVDPLGVALASERACELIAELAGGRPVGGLVRVGGPDPQLRQVAMRPARCSQLLGIELDQARQGALLERLGLGPKVQGETIVCTIPSYRLDLTREVDLIEEVARMHGLDALPIHGRIAIEAAAPGRAQALGRRVLATLVGYGFHETITPSLLTEPHGRAFLPPDAQLVRLDADHRRADAFLRPSVLASLMVCRKSNQDLGNHGLRLFETAAVWWRQADGTIHEEDTLAFLMDVQDAQHDWRLARGMVEELFTALGGQDISSRLRLEPVEATWAAHAASVRLDEQVIGWIGLAAAATQQLFDLQSPVLLGSLNWQALVDADNPVRVVGELPRFPGIERDLSLVVDETCHWARFEAVLGDLELAKLESIRFVTTYRGKPLEKGTKSVTFRLFFRDPAATLRHEDVDRQVEQVVKAAEDRLHAQLRR